MKFHGFTPMRLAGTTCQISSIHFGAEQNLLDVWEDRELVSGECLPGPDHSSPYPFWVAINVVGFWGAIEKISLTPINGARLIS